MDPEYVDVGLVVAQADLRQGPAGRGPPGHAVLPALRAPGCPTTSWRRGTRPWSTRRSTSASRSPAGPLAELGAALLVWTTTPWTLVSNTAVAVHPDVTYVVARHRSTGEVLVVAEPLLDSVLGDDWHVADVARGHRPGATALPAAVRPGRRSPARHYRRAGRLRHDRRRHRPGPPGARVRRRGPRDRSRSTACRWSTRSARTDVRGRSAAGRRPVLQEGGRGARRRPPGARPAVPPSGRTSTPTRTAGAATRRCSTTRCRPGTSAPPRSRTRCCARTSAPTGTRRPSSGAGTATGCATTSTGRCRAAATGARRCRSGAATDGHVTVRRLPRRAGQRTPAAT